VVIIWRFIYPESGAYFPDNETAVHLLEKAHSDVYNFEFAKAANNSKGLQFNKCGHALCFACEPEWVADFFNAFFFEMTKPWCTIL
jgi:hypothetical protein